jgi:ribosomal protein L29
MLLTELQISRRKGLNFPQPGRIDKVRKSMGAIKHVLGERKREHLSRLKAAKEEEQNDAQAA